MCVVCFLCGVFLVSIGALGVAEKKRSYSIEDDVFWEWYKGYSIWGCLQSSSISLREMDKYELMETKIPVACEMCYAVYSAGWCQLKSQAHFLRASGGRSKKGESQEFVNNCTHHFISNTAPLPSTDYLIICYLHRHDISSYFLHLRDSFE